MKYFLLTLKHKWFVFIAGFSTKAPLWSLIIHDWSKLLPYNLYHYNKQFFGKKDAPKKFAFVWLAHQNTHRHHWEYWVPRTLHCKSLEDTNWRENEPVPMPEWAVREMVADWLGASRAYEGHWPDPNNWKWLDKNFNRMQLHHDTMQMILNIIEELKAKKW